MEPLGLEPRVSGCKNNALPTSPQGRLHFVTVYGRRDDSVVGKGHIQFQY